MSDQKVFTKDGQFPAGLRPHQRRPGSEVLEVAMRERPILFSGPMVRAILEGRKSQTRRVVKPGPPPCQKDADAMFPYRHGWRYSGVDYACEHDLELCPYGKPGDRLWVRETWRPYSWHPNEMTVQMRADNKVCDVEIPDTNEGEAWLDRICEAAAHECQKQAIEEEDGMYVWDGEEENPIRWRPSIFMPRWASRITLEITEVRVQRLQEISEEDAIAEGCEPWQFGSEQCMTSGQRGADSPYRGGYACLWDEINADRATWKSNPWVWAVSFKVVRP